eukprot:221348_1
MIRTTRSYMVPILTRRQFSSDNDSMNIVKTGILRFISVSSKFKKQVKELKKWNIDVKEHPMSDDIDNPLQHESTFFVGDFNQYPDVAHSNVAKFYKLYLRHLLPKHVWTTNEETKRLIGIDITSTVDYNPFPITFPKDKKSKKLKWKPKTEHKYRHLEDSYGDNMSLLTRNIKGNPQELLLWRDVHPDIKNISRIEQLISEYQPDKIILEYPAEGAGLKRYVSTYNKITSKLLKLRQHFVMDNNSFKVGNRWYWGKLRFTITNSFAIDQAIIISIQNNIPIVLSDYAELPNKLLIVGAQALDKFPQALWLAMNFPFNKFMKLSNRSTKLPINFEHLVSLRMRPHFVMQCSYRNDMMSLAINECVEPKLLYIGGASHIQDIIDRLNGIVEIRNPFKTIDERRVELKHLTPYYYSGESKINLDDKDIEIVKHHLDENAYELMCLTNEQLYEKLLERLKHIIPQEQLQQIQSDYRNEKSQHTK